MRDRSGCRILVTHYALRVTEPAQRYPAQPTHTQHSRQEPRTMFPLTGKDFPDSAEALSSAIQGSLAQVLTLPKKDSAVSIGGGKFPKVKTLKIDLSGATVSAAEPPPKPKPTGKREPGIEVDQLDVVGHPIKYEKNKLDLSLNARGVKFDYGRDKK